MEEAIEATALIPSGPPNVDRVLSQRPGEPQPAGQPLLPPEDGGPLPLPPLLPLAIRGSLQVKSPSYQFIVSSAINCQRLSLAVPRASIVNISTLYSCQYLLSAIP